MDFSHNYTFVPILRLLWDLCGLKFIAFAEEIKSQISNYKSQINHNDQNSKFQTIGG